MQIYETTYEITKETASLSGLMYLAQEAAGAHCDLLGYPWESLRQRQLFWAVIRVRGQLTRLPLAGETVTVKTWPLPTTKTAYPRQVVILDHRGQVLAKLLSLWVLMDTGSRKLVLPGRSGITVTGCLLGGESEVPRSLPPVSGETVTSRIVTEAELDRNGHMNNAKYLDWVQTCLGDRGISGFTVNYLAEALEGDALQLRCQTRQTDIQVDIVRGDRRIFAAEILTIEN